MSDNKAGGVQGRRRVLSAEGDSDRMVWRVAKDTVGRLIARLASLDTQESDAPSATLEVGPDGSWMLLTGPRGPYGYQVLRAAGCLGDDPADAFPCAGDTVTANPRRADQSARVTFDVRTVDNEAGEVVAPDGRRFAFSDVRLIARGGQAGPPSLIPAGYQRMDSDARERAREDAQRQAQAWRDDIARMYVVEAVMLTLQAFDGQGLGWITYTVDWDGDGVVQITITELHDGDGKEIDMGDWDSAQVREALAAAAEWSDDFSTPYLPVEVAVGDYVL